MGSLMWREQDGPETLFFVSASDVKGQRLHNLEFRVQFGSPAASATKIVSGTCAQTGTPWQAL